MNHTLEVLHQGVHYSAQTLAGFAGAGPVQHLVEGIQHVRQLPGTVTDTIRSEWSGLVEFIESDDAEIADGNINEAFALGFRDDEILALIPGDVLIESTDPSIG